LQKKFVEVIMYRQNSTQNRRRLHSRRHNNNNNNNNNNKTDKILKFKDITIEIQRMWNVKTKMIPVKIIGPTGTISSHSENM